ncbi:hypothetical protein YC2023_062343 [Brassica napus]
MCDVVVGALSRIHLDPLRGGDLDPRLVALDWNINEVVGVWGDSELAFWCSDPDLCFAFVDLWCERKLRRVLLRRSGFGSSHGVFRSVSCFVVEWGSKLSQDGDLASRLCQRLCLVLRGDDGGSAMSKRARWILWLCGRSIFVVCACNRSLEVHDLSSMAPLFSLWFVLLGPLCLEPLVSHCSMFSVYMAWWFSTVRKNEWVHVLCTRSEGSVRVPDWVNWISRIVLRSVIPVRGGSLGLLRRPFLLFLQVLMFAVFGCLSLSRFGPCPLGSRSGVAVSGVKSGLWLVWLLVSCYMNKSSTCLALWLASSS